MSMKLSRGDRSRAWLAVTDAIKRDPVVRREVKVLIVLDGSRADCETEPGTKTRPWVRLVPMPGRTEVADTCSLHAPMTIRVEMCLDGTDATQVLDLWARFEAIVFDPDNATGFRAAGIVSLVPSLDHFEVVRSDASLRAHGSIEIEQYIDR